MKDPVEIIEYWNGKEKVYEMMLSSEFDKKRAGLPYEVFVRDTIPPFVIRDSFPEHEWIGQKRMTEKHLLPTPVTEEKI